MTRYVIKLDMKMQGSISDSILALTSDWCVVNKPSGWLTRAPDRPDAGDLRPVLRLALEQELGRKLWVVHRLDFETTGVLLYALNSEAHRRGSLAFEKHQVKKLYRALVGPIGSRSDVGSGAVAPVFKVNEPIEGRAAVTQFEVKKRYANGVFEIVARPLSGRRHQIRLHLASRGLPILGDVQYGGLREFAGIEFPRVALHAEELSLPSGETFVAPLPLDFTQWLGKCGEPS